MVDQEKLNQFLGKFVGDLGATMHAATVVVGQRLGLYGALAEGGRLTPAELGERTGVLPRYAAEWLAAQAASGYVEYDPASGRFHLTPEQACALADESSPAYVAGAFLLAGSVFKDEEAITAAYRNGRGLGWHEHHHDLFHGTEKFFRPGYVANLASTWIPALDGVLDKLERGARVADVGCGHGATTILMAKAYPKARLFGFDYHEASIEEARRAAEREGVADRVTFVVAPAKAYPGQDYDLVTFFDCLHDMGDPAGAAAHVRRSLKDDGTWMVVEPRAGDRLEDNLNPVGRVFYSASTTICTPASLSQEVGLGLGAQAGEKRLGEVIRSGGFTRVRRACENPFNMVLEARP